MTKAEQQKRAERLVRVWQQSSCAEEAALRLGRTVASVQSRASYYRMTGVPLKYMGPPRKHPMGLDRAVLRGLVKRWAATMSKIA